MVGGHDDSYDRIGDGRDDDEEDDHVGTDEVCADWEGPPQLTGMVTNMSLMMMAIGSHCDNDDDDWKSRRG